MDDNYLLVETQSGRRWFGRLTNCWPDEPYLGLAVADSDFEEGSYIAKIYEPILFVVEIDAEHAGRLSISVNRPLLHAQELKVDGEMRSLGRGRRGPAAD